MFTTEQEAAILGRYIVRKPIDAALVSRYANAIRTLNTLMGEKEQRLWQHCLGNPWLLSLVDSGLALSQPFSGIRYRIYIMFCILETSPDFASEFLPQKRSAWFLPGFILEMAFAGFKSVIGLLMLKIFWNVREN